MNTITVRAATNHDGVTIEIVPMHTPSIEHQYKELCYHDSAAIFDVLYSTLPSATFRDLVIAFSAYITEHITE